MVLVLNCMHAIGVRCWDIFIVARDGNFTCGMENITCLDCPGVHAAVHIPGHKQNTIIMYTTNYLKDWIPLRCFPVALHHPIFIVPACLT